MITIFVSSTFKDMQAERDALQQTVAPALNAAAVKYGKSVSFSDLRWGVNTLDLDSEKGAKKVLDVCLDEIDRCEPPMIVILGYRYGWIPSQETLKNSVERKNLILQDLNMSVTALEIEYGALCRAPERTLFYFREIDNDAPERYLGEDEEHIKKLNELKRRIENLAGRNLRTYHMKWNGERLEGIDEFAKLVEKDVLKLLQPEWERDKNLTPFERERNTQWAFVREKAAFFRAKLPLLEELVQRVNGGAEKLIIKGASGMGKSTLFSSLAVRLREEGYDVLPFIGGYTLESNTAFDVLKNTVYYVEDKLSLDHFAFAAGEALETGRKQATVKDWRNRLEEVCRLYAETGVKLVIMLDAADQLNDDDNRDDLVFIPYNLSSNVRFIMTCIDDFPVLGDCVTLAPLDKKDRMEIIKGILSPINKELDKRVVEEIISKKGAGNALYISLLVQRLLLLRADDFDKMTDPQTISAHQRDILAACPDELEGMSVALFREAGTHVNGKLIQQCMEYIAASRHGLRVCDLAALLDKQWNYLDFIHFVYYMNDCFMVRDDGRYDFTHKSLRLGLLKTGNRSDVLKKLADYFIGLPPSDEIRINELGYHLIRDNRYRQFVECVNADGGADRAYRNALSNDLYEQCCLDGGDWALKVLQSGKEYGVGVDFCLFIGEEVGLRFNSGRKELETVERIMLADIALLEELNNVNGQFLHAADAVGQEDIPETEESLASYTEMMNGVLGEMFSRGLLEGAEGLTAEDLLIGVDELKQTVAQTGGIKSFLQQSSTAMAYAETVKGNRSDVNALSSCYRILSNVYSDCGDIERLNKAIDIRERSILLNQALLVLDGDDAVTSLLLCSDYTAISKLYAAVGTAEFTAKAEQTAEAAVDMAKSLNASLKGTGMEGLGVMSLSDSLATMADVKTTASEYDVDAVEERIALYNKALDWVKTMEEGTDKAFATADLYKKLGASYRMLSVMTLRGKHNGKLAYDYYLKSIAVYERLYKEKPDTDTLEALASSYRDIACDYNADEDNKKAVAYFKKAIDLRKILREKLNTDASALELASAYSELAGVYLDNGDKKMYGEALEANRQYMSVVLEIASKNNTVSSRRRVSAAYEILARTYRAMGGKENLKLAYDLLKKRKQAERTLEIETGILCDENRININYLSLVDVVKEMGGDRELTEELLAIGEEDVAFYSKACGKEEGDAAQRLLAGVLNMVAEAYCEFDSVKQGKRITELYEKAASCATDFFSYYSAKMGVVRILAESGEKEDGLRAIDVCKEMLDTADLENNAEEIKSDELSCLWIMDCADNMVKLFEKLEPNNRAEIDYYKALSEEYQLAMISASGLDDDD
ncbi:MAG: DUF4062 domain-containing protein [Candidatus Coproplasma sp.]